MSEFTAQPPSILERLGQKPLLEYISAQNCTLGAAAQAMKDTLQRQGLRTVEQLGRHASAAALIGNLLTKIIADESAIIGQDISVAFPHGSFHFYDAVSINGFPVSRIELMSSHDSQEIHGQVSSICIGDAWHHNSYGAVLGLTVNGDYNLAGSAHEGWYFVPLSGNDITITPPACLN